MKFLELSYCLPLEMEERIGEDMAAMGFSNFYIENQPKASPVLKVFLGQEGEAGVEEHLQALGLEKSSSLWREELDWLSAWMETLEAFELAKGVWINPFPDRELVREELVLRVVPGTSFGTGLHTTTRLAARILNELPLRGQSVLDVGSGTGILALLAQAKGASRVLCLDNDVNAAQKAKDTFEANGFEAPDARTSDLLDALEVGEYFDIIVANIIQEILTALMDHQKWKALLQGGQPVVFSGISDGKRIAMEKAMIDRGLKVFRHLNEEGWNAYLVGLA